MVSVRQTFVYFFHNSVDNFCIRFGKLRDYDRNFLSYLGRVYKKKAIQLPAANQAKQFRQNSNRHISDDIIFTAISMPTILSLWQRVLDTSHSGKGCTTSVDIVVLRYTDAAGLEDKFLSTYSIIRFILIQYRNFSIYMVECQFPRLTQMTRIQHRRQLQLKLKLTQTYTDSLVESHRLVFT